MPSVRISGNWQNVNRMDWAGAPKVDKAGHIERSIDIPEEAFVAIEEALKGGAPEGDVFIKDGSRFHWFLDK